MSKIQTMKLLTPCPNLTLAVQIAMNKVLARTNPEWKAKVENNSCVMSILQQSQPQSEFRMNIKLIRK